MTVGKLVERLGKFCPNKEVRLNCVFGNPVVGLSIDYEEKKVWLEDEQDATLTGRPYTVQDLIESLAGEDVTFRVYGHSKDGNELLFSVEYVDSDEPVWLEDEQDSDLYEELPVIFEKALEEQADELDFYMDLLETGITVHMVKKYVGYEEAYHMEVFCVEHGLLDETEVRKVLVYVSSTEDGDDYVLRNGLGHIVLDSSDCPVIIKSDAIKKCMEETQALNKDGIVRMLARAISNSNNFVIADADTMEQMDGFGSRVLFDEDLIDFFIGTKQDYSHAFWKAGVKKALYLKSIDYGLDILGADGYAHCYDLFERDIDFGYYFKVCSVLEQHGCNDILEADRVEDNYAWKIIVENIFEGSDRSIYSLEDIKDYWSRHSFVCYNDKDFYEWFENQTVFKKIA